MLQALHHRSQWQSLQLLHLEGHVFYAVSFTYKGELAWLGVGQREETNSVYPGNCSCYCKRPWRAHYKLLCEAVPPWSASHVASPQPPGWGPRSASATRLSRAAGPRGRGGDPRPGLRTASMKARGAAARWRHRRPARPRLLYTRGGGGARVLRRLQPCKTPRSSPSRGTTGQLFYPAGAPQSRVRPGNNDLEPEEGQLAVKIL